MVTGDISTSRAIVTGDAVNTAARLEEAAEPGEILLGLETYRLTSHAIAAEPLEPLVLRGKSAPVDALRLIEVRPGSGRSPVRMDSPILGRDRQLRLLTDTFDEAVADRACYLVTIAGAAGIGKSRLALEFVEHLDEAVVITGRCLPYGEGITFWPVAEMVRQAAGIDDADGPESARARIRDLIDGSGDGDVVAMHLSRLIGLSEGARAEPGWALRRFLETLALRAPVVAMFDDVHWAEPALVEAIEQVADMSRDAPILLLCLARPEMLDDHPTWGAGRTRSASIQLEPLAQTDCRTLIQNLVGGGTVDEAIVDRVLDTARGHPLFVEQMLSGLLETGAIVPKDDRWVPTCDLEAVGTPAFISALLSARIDRLSDREQSVLAHAGVVGEVFDRRAVEALVPDDVRPSIEGLLQRLVRKDLIRPAPRDAGAQDVYRFRHILVRDVAYEALPKQERALLHEHLADWIERTSGPRIAEFEELAGYHLEQAYRYRAELGPIDDLSQALAARAASRLASAGRRVHETRWDAYGSANLLSRAWTLVPPEHPIRLEIGPELAAALAESGELDEANRVIDATLEAAVRSSDDVAAVRARLTRWQLRGRSDPTLDVALMEADADEAIAFFEERHDGVGAAKAWLLKADARWMLTDYGGRVAACERAAQHAREAGAGWELAEALGGLMWALVAGTSPSTSARSASSRSSRRLEGAPTAGWRPMPSPGSPAWPAIAATSPSRESSARRALSSTAIARARSPGVG